MKKILAALCFLALINPAKAVDSTVSAMSSASAFAGTELLYVVQVGADRKGTPAQMATYVYSLMTGDCTVTGNAITCTKINGVTFPSSGTSGGVPYFSATGAISSSGALTANLPVIGGGAGVAPSSGTRSGNTTGFATFTGTVTGGTNCAQWDANGNLTAAGASCGTGGGTPGGSNTQLQYNNSGAFGGVTAATWTGSVLTFTSPIIATGATLSFLTGSTQCVQVNTSGVISGTGAACGGSGSTGANPTATAGPAAVNGVATTFMRSDGAPAVQQGSSSQKGIVQVDGTTITESSGVISAAPASATPNLQTGTNYAIQGTDRGKVIYLSNASAQTPTIAQAGTGSFTTGWYTTACNIAAGAQTITPTTSTIGGAATFVLTPGSAGSPRCVTIISDGTNYVIIPEGNAYTIASGTSSLGTSAIASGACATVVTTSAPGVATTDVILVGFNGDPTAVTGYAPSANGMLTIINYPSANNVNHKVCNNTGSSITPGAITLNWRVAR